MSLHPTADLSDTASHHGSFLSSDEGSQGAIIPLEYTLPIQQPAMPFAAAGKYEAALKEAAIELEQLKAESEAKAAAKAAKAAKKGPPMSRRKKIMILVIVGILAIGLIVGIVVWQVLKKKKEDGSGLANLRRVPEITNMLGPNTNTTVPLPGNGTVTDPASTPYYQQGTNSRVALLVPGQVYSDFPGWLPFYKALVIQGVPVTVTKTVSEAILHPMVIVYQGLNSPYLQTTDPVTWTSYVAGGNTLVSIGHASTDVTLGTLFGITTVDATTNKQTRAAIVLSQPVTGTSAPIVSTVNGQFDFTDVRDQEISLWAQTTNIGFATVGYKLDNSTGSTAVPLATYRLNAATAADTTFAAISVKTNTAGGRAIAIGIDVGAYVGLSNGAKTGGIPRSYVSQYEPGYDNFFRILKTLYSTSTPTGLVTSWPVPGNKGVHFGWTYDIDAQDSYSLALTIGKDLQSRGIKGTINWQAKIVEDAYDVQSFSDYYRNISLVEALGNMEMASHSVSHSPNLLRFPVGTGREKFHGISFNEDNYWPFIGECVNSTTTPITPITKVPNATLCDTLTNELYFYTVGASLMGEARVSKWILEQISIWRTTQVISFRTGHLLFPDALPQVLVASGYKYDSSSATNDQNTHMPFQNFYNRNFNQEVDLLELSMTSSDEDGKINGDWALPGDKIYPLGSYAYQQFVVLQKIAKYGGQYTFLIHPTTAGRPGLVQTLFSDKLAFQQTLTPLIANISYFDSMQGRGDFQKARMQTGIDVSVNGDQATVQVTLPLDIIDLTLRVPTTWSLVSSSVGVDVSTPGAVILLGKVSAGSNPSLVFNTAGAGGGSPKMPGANSSPTTITVVVPSPTIPVPSPTSTKTLVVDDFEDPVRYNNGNNSLLPIPGYTDDDGTSAGKPSVQADYLFLQATNTSYWYTKLGGPNTCNDYSRFTSLNMAVRFPSSAPFGFLVGLQDVAANATSCADVAGAAGLLSPQMHQANAGGLVATTPPTGDQGWIQFQIPLSNYVNLNLKRLQSLTLSQFAAAGNIEIDYIEFWE